MLSEKWCPLFGIMLKELVIDRLARPPFGRLAGCRCLRT